MLSELGSLTEGIFSVGKFSLPITYVMRPSPVKTAHCLVEAHRVRSNPAIT